MKLPTFFTSKKKLIRTIRTVLFMALLVAVGQLIRQGYDRHIDRKTQKYIRYIDKKTQEYVNLPIIKKEIIQFTETDECYQITNEKYRVYCWIDHYIPYNEDIDTSFIVFHKAGVQICGQRNERILMDYFRKEFRWSEDKEAMVEYYKKHLGYR